MLYTARWCARLGGVDCRVVCGLQGEQEDLASCSRFPAGVPKNTLLHCSFVTLRSCFAKKPFLTLGAGCGRAKQSLIIVKINRP